MPDEEILYRHFGLDVRASKEDKRAVDVIASTGAIDSYDEIVSQDWKLDRYLANPVVLLEHNRGGGLFDASGAVANLPIGYAKNVRVEDGKLKATLVFVSEKANPTAELVYNQYLEGSMRAVSVGFRTGDVESRMVGDREIMTLSRNELYEISAVSIPANPEAVAQARAKSIDTLRRRAAAKHPPVAEEKPMSLEAIAKRLGCEPNEVAILAALDLRERAAAQTQALSAQVLVTELSAAEKLGRVALAALDLNERSSEGELTKKIVELTTKAAKFDEVQPEIERLQKESKEREEKSIVEDVDLVVRMRSSDENSRKLMEGARNALTAHRKTMTSEQFATEYKAEFDKAKDLPHMHKSLTTPGGSLAPASLASQAPVLMTDGVDDFDALVDQYMQEQKAAGRIVSRATAIAAVSS